MLNILPSTCGYSRLSLYLQLARLKPCIHVSSLPYVPHAPSISPVDFNTQMTFGVQYKPRSFPLPVFPQPTTNFLPVRHRYLLQQRILEPLPPFVRGQVSHSYSTADTILVLQILMTILAREGNKWREEEEEDVGSYWVILRTREDMGALDWAFWRTCFGRGNVTVVRQTAECMNVLVLSAQCSVLFEDL